MFLLLCLEHKNREQEKSFYETFFLQKNNKGRNGVVEFVPLQNPEFDGELKVFKTVPKCLHYWIIMGLKLLRQSWKWVLQPKWIHYFFCKFAVAFSSPFLLVQCQPDLSLSSFSRVRWASSLHKRMSRQVVLARPSKA